MSQLSNTYHINELQIPNETHFFKEDNGNKGKTLRNISKINIFIGANNSGKSKLLRDILQKKSLYKPHTYSLEIIKKTIADLKNEIDSYFEKKRIDKRRDIEDLFLKLEIPEYVDESFELDRQINNLKLTIEKFQKNQDTTYGNYQLSKIGNDLMPIFQKYNTILQTECKTNFSKVEFTKIYVPILRGLRPLSGTREKPNYNDSYRDRTIFDYFSTAYISGDPEWLRIRYGEKTQDSDEKIKIFTGLGAFDQIKKILLGNLQERKLISDYEKYLSENFFDDKPVAIIPSETTQILTLKIGDEKEQPIFNQGDGLQSIIIATLPLFLHRNQNVLFFIDEPEKLLHPGLQRKFIETLLTQEGFESFQFFITTHSNHFLDLTLDFNDISIFSFKKIFNEEIGEEKVPNFLIEPLSVGDRNALELLGVRNSSVFLSNCTIWVEGITDRLYYRHYLDLYQEFLHRQDSSEKKYKEDFHYSFVEFGGANITHFSFLSKEENPITVERLCGKSLVIADKNIGSQTTRKELKEKLKGRCFLLKSNEVENLLKKSVLLNVLKEYEGEEPDIKEFTEKDYKNVYLGQFIEEKLKNKKRHGSYKQDSGTITDKIGFCRKSLKYIKKWDDLSPEAKNLTEIIFNHIKSHNP